MFHKLYVYITVKCIHTRLSDQYFEVLLFSHEWALQLFVECLALAIHQFHGKCLYVSMTL